MKCLIELSDGKTMFKEDTIEWDKKNIFIRTLGFIFPSIKYKYVKLTGWGCEIVDNNFDDEVYYIDI